MSKHRLATRSSTQEPTESCGVVEKFAFCNEMVGRAPVLNQTAREGPDKGTVFPLANRYSRDDRRSRCVLLGGSGSNSVLNVFISEPDHSSFVAVQDTGNRAAITVLPFGM